MDRLILAEKLESLRRCVARIERWRVDSSETLAADVDAQDILALNLTRAVQLCVDMAVHADQRIDWAIVHRLTHDEVEDLRAFAEHLDRLLQ